MWRSLHGSITQLDNKACRMKISFPKSGVKFPVYLRMGNGGHKKTAPTVVVHDEEGETGAGEDHSHVKIRHAGRITTALGIGTAMRQLRLELPLLLPITPLM